VATDLISPEIRRFLVTQVKALLKTAEAAERIPCTERYMRKLVADGKIPVVRIGRLVRIDPADLDAFIDRHRVAGGDAA
jgi:excisionase family DNA binding protein